MKDKYKTKDQLINDLMELRQRVTELEAAETKRKLRGEALRYQARRAIATDITERKMTKEALIKINARLKHLLTSTPAVVYACEPTSNYTTTFMSENVRTQLGYEPQEFLDDPKFWSHHIHPEDKARIFAGLRYLFEKGHQTHEYRFQHKNGTYRWMHDELRLVRDAKGKPLEIVGYWTDITERKEVEKTLKKSEEKFRTFLDNLGDAAYMTDSQGNITYANKMAEKITGVPLENLIGKPFLPLFNEESQKVAIDVYQRTLNGESPEYELTFTNEKIGYFKNEPLRDKDGKIIGVFGIARDITKRKQLEEALRASEKRFRNLAELLPQIVFETDERGQLTFINRKAFEFFGFTQEDIDRGFDVIQGVIPEDQDRARKNLQRRLSREDPGYVEYTAVRKDGSKFPVIVYSSPIIRENKVVGLRGIAIDITERKQTEEVLRESEEKYRTLVESSIDGIGLAMDGKIVFGSGGLLKMFGYNRLEEVIGKPIEFVTIPEEREKIKTRHLDRLRGEITTNRYEFKGLRKDGTIMDIEGSFNTVSYQGRPAVLAILRDITENKRMMMELEESEEKYRKLFENASDAIFITDIKPGIILDANKQAEQLIGCPREEIIGMHQSELYPPDCAESHWMFRKHMEKGNTFNLEAEVVKKDGTIVPVFISASAIRIRRKKVVQGIFRDITQEKKISDLREEIEAKKLIEKASRILAGHHKITKKEAIRRLQKQSRNQRRKMRDIAWDIVSSGLILD